MTEYRWDNGYLITNNANIVATVSTRSETWTFWCEHQPKRDGAYMRFDTHQKSYPEATKVAQTVLILEGFI